MELLQEKERHIPGSVQYFIKRYRHNPQWNMDDTGMMVYHFRKGSPKENYLELKFCITGNVYCSKPEAECGDCRNNTLNDCDNRVQTIDVLSFRFSNLHL